MSGAWRGWVLVLVLGSPLPAHAWGGHGVTRSAYYYYPAPVLAAPVYAPLSFVPVPPAPLYVPRPVVYPPPAPAVAVPPGFACPATAPPSGAVIVPGPAPATVPPPPNPVTPTVPAPGGTPSTAPPTSAPPSPGPVTPAPSRKLADDSSSPYFDTYTVARRPTDPPPGERCQVNFWNLAGHEVSLKVGDQTVAVAAGKKLTLDLGRHFIWRMDNREPQSENIPAGESGMEIVLRR